MALDYATISQPIDRRIPGGRGLHALALLTAACTFPLIFMGGLVTTHQAGMSVPDWPNSFGYNMFLFPPNKWVGGIFYEHTHRLMGTVVGFLSILLVICAWKTECRRVVRWLAAGVLAMVIFQGILGGLRVVLVKLNLAIVHACVAQAFFCLACLVSIVTSNWWLKAPAASRLSADGRRLIALGIVTVAVIYLQLIIGAVMRHYQAGLAVTDFPLIYGHALPPMTAADLRAINAHRAWSTLQPDAGVVDSKVALQLSRPVTFEQIWVHALHRYGAICVTIAVLALAAQAIVRHRNVNGIAGLAVLLVVLLTAQITLGSLVVLLRKPADITSLHVAIGALTLATAFALTARAWRLYAAPVEEKVFEPAQADRIRDPVLALEH